MSLYDVYFFIGITQLRQKEKPYKQNANDWRIIE